MDFTINQRDNGDWEVRDSNETLTRPLRDSVESYRVLSSLNEPYSPTSFSVTSIINQPTKRTFMSTTKKDFILLSPLYPSIFGYEDHEVSRMITELQDVGIQVMLVDTGPEMMFYARASEKSTLESLCTTYDIGGILVEAAAVYDQVVLTEVV